MLDGLQQQILRLEGHAPVAELVGKVAPGAAVAEEAASLVEQRHAAFRTVLTVPARGHVTIAEFTKRPVRAPLGQCGFPINRLGVTAHAFLADLPEGYSGITHCDTSPDPQP